MLAANSPYINSGVAISNNGGLDFWGNPVANGATDLGAGEFNAGAVVSPGATVLTGDLFAEQSAVTSVSVVGATPTTSALLGDDAVTSMSQSFQVDSDFDLEQFSLTMNMIHLVLEIYSSMSKYSKWLTLEPVA